MSTDELLAEVEDKRIPVPQRDLDAFESSLGQQLPEEYRRFLMACNGGFLDGRFMFAQLSVISAIYGFRNDVSLTKAREKMRQRRLPKVLIPIMKDPFGSEICIGVTGAYTGKIYFWNSKIEAEVVDDWDGDVETARHVTLIANSLSSFFEALQLSPYGRCP
jgi:hypothetical protein